jgi:hypothetical protein
MDCRHRSVPFKPRSLWTRPTSDGAIQLRPDSDPAAGRANVPYRTEWNPRGERDFIHPQLNRARTSWFGASGEVGLDLDITYTESTIYDPATNHLDRVGLRSYRDARQPTPPKVPANDPSGPGTPGKPNIPHCFNQTNLHSHGLWVSPAGSSDNVLVNIGARREFPI